MKNNNKKDEGFAMIMVLIFASILFILVAVTLNGYFAWQKINRRLAEDNSRTAEKIIVLPDK